MGRRASIATAEVQGGMITSLACALALSLGLSCTAENADFMRTGGADGGEGQTDGAAAASSASAATSATASTTTTKGSSTAAATTSPSDSAGTPGSGSSSTTLDETSDDSTTVDRTAVETDSDEALVVLFATEPTSGDFAFEGPVALAGAELCENTIEDAGLALDCSALTVLIATEFDSFLDIGLSHPELTDSPLVGLDFEPLARSYAQLVLGDVEAGFANAVTEHLGAPNDPSFWWGPSAGAGDHCEEWSVPSSTGRGLTFDSAGAAGPLSVVAPCNQSRHLLCACFTTW